MKKHRFLDLTGHHYGRLTVLSPAESPPGVKSRDQYWRCVCDCGTEHTASAKGLRHSGKATGTQSCGCLHRERSAASAAVSSFRHGHARVGMATPEYRSWCALVKRCTSPQDPNYPSYGGRGITVCERWQNSFENFLADMGRKPSQQHSIDRIDNDGNYEPGNCRWATRSEQSRNRRDRILVTFNGRTMFLCDWSAKTGISVGTLHYRLYNRGWSVERALTTNPKSYHRRDG
jgi:hypothetical protein